MKVGRPRLRGQLFSKVEAPATSKSPRMLKSFEIDPLRQDPRAAVWPGGERLRA